MPYTYGTQNAPAVGNGLGGLPRRATPSAPAPASTAPTHLKRVGTPFTLVNGSTWSNINALPIAVVSPTEFWFYFTYYDGSNTWYQMRRATVAGDSVTVVDTYQNTTQGISVSTVNSAVIGGVLYTFGEEGQQNIYKYTPSRTLVTSTFPTSGTVTYGSGAGSPWSTGVNGYNPACGINGGFGTQYQLRALSNGNLVVFRAGTINSNKSILAHTINPSTGAIVATYGVFNTGDSTYFDGMAFHAIQYETDKFAVFCVYSKMFGGTDPYVYGHAGSVNFVNNTAGQSYSGYGNTAGARSYVGSNMLKIANLGYVIKQSWSSSYVHRIFFPIAADGTPNANPTGTNLNAETFMASGLVYDSAYADNFPLYGGTFSADRDLPSLSYSVSNLDVKPWLANFTSFDITNEQTLVSGSILSPATKALLSNTSDANSSAWGPPFSFPGSVAARVGEFDFFALMYDQNGSAQRVYMQKVSKVA